MPYASVWEQGRGPVWDTALSAPSGLHSPGSPSPGSCLLHNVGVLLLSLHPHAQLIPEDLGLPAPGCPPSVRPAVLLAADRTGQDRPSWPWGPHLCQKHSPVGPPTLLPRAPSVPRSPSLTTGPWTPRQGLPVVLPLHALPRRPGLSPEAAASSCLASCLCSPTSPHATASGQISLQIILHSYVIFLKSSWILPLSCAKPPRATLIK